MTQLHLVAAGEGIETTDGEYVNTICPLVMNLRVALYGVLHNRLHHHHQQIKNMGAMIFEAADDVSGTTIEWLFEMDRRNNTTYANAMKSVWRQQRVVTAENMIGSFCKDKDVKSLIMVAWATHRLKYMAGDIEEGIEPTYIIKPKTYAAIDKILAGFLVQWWDYNEQQAAQAEATTGGA